MSTIKLSYHRSSTAKQQSHHKTLKQHSLHKSPTSKSATPSQAANHQVLPQDNHKKHQNSPGQRVHRKANSNKSTNAPFYNTSTPPLPLPPPRPRNCIFTRLSNKVINYSALQSDIHLTRPPSRRLSPRKEIDIQRPPIAKQIQIQASSGARVSLRTSERDKSGLSRVLWGVCVVRDVPREERRP